MNDIKLNEKTMGAILKSGAMKALQMEAAHEVKRAADALSESGRADYAVVQDTHSEGYVHTHIGTGGDSPQTIVNMRSNIKHNSLVTALQTVVDGRQAWTF